MTGSIFFFFCRYSSFYFTAGEREIRYGTPVQCDSRLACLESCGYSVSSTGGTPHAQLSAPSFRSVTTEGGGVMKMEGRVRKGAGGERHRRV